MCPRESPISSSVYRVFVKKISSEGRCFTGINNGCVIIFIVRGSVINMIGTAKFAAVIYSLYTMARFHVCSVGESMDFAVHKLCIFRRLMPMYA